MVRCLKGLTTPQAICLSKHLYGFDEIRRKTFVSWSNHTTRCLKGLTTPQAICLSKHLYGFDEIRRKTFVSLSDV